MNKSKKEAQKELDELLKQEKSINSKKQELEAILNADEDDELIAKIKGYEDACTDHNIKPLTVNDFSFLPEFQQQAMFSFHKADLIHSSLNPGYKVKYDNSNQEKWWNWFSVNKSGGVGFSHSDDGYARTYATVGSRFFSKSKKISTHFGKITEAETKDIVIK